MLWLGGKGGADLQRVDELEVAVQDAHLGHAHHAAAVGPQLRLAARQLGEQVSYRLGAGLAPLRQVHPRLPLEPLGEGGLAHQGSARIEELDLLRTIVEVAAPTRDEREDAVAEQVGEVVTGVLQGANEVELHTDRDAVGTAHAFGSASQ